MLVSISGIHCHKKVIRTYSYAGGNHKDITAFQSIDDQSWCHVHSEIDWTGRPCDPYKNRWCRGNRTVSNCLSLYGFILMLTSGLPMTFAIATAKAPAQGWRI